MVLANVTRISDEQYERERKLWVENQRTLMVEGYFARAKEAYRKIWDSCAGSSAGHNPQRVDLRGNSVNICTLCGYNYPSTAASRSSGTSASARLGQQRECDKANTLVIESLRDRMIELDKEAGILTFPTVDDFKAPRPSERITVVNGKPKTKKKWF
jgi:hypothetical protein